MTKLDETRRLPSPSASKTTTNEVASPERAVTTSSSTPGAGFQASGRVLEIGEAAREHRRGRVGGEPARQVDERHVDLLKGGPEARQHHTRAVGCAVAAAKANVRGRARRLGVAACAAAKFGSGGGGRSAHRRVRFSPAGHVAGGPLAPAAQTPHPKTRGAAGERRAARVELGAAGERHAVGTLAGTLPLELAAQPPPAIPAQLARSISRHAEQGRRSGAGVKLRIDLEAAERGARQ